MCQPRPHQPAPSFIPRLSYAHHPSGSGGDALIKVAHYWHSTVPTSKPRIPIQVGGGDIGVYYLREPAGIVGEESSVECWVHDNYGGRRLLRMRLMLGMLCLR